MHYISETIKNLWISTRKTKITSGGWISGNAICCIHNNDSPDHKGRGGILITDTSIAYSCFNCGYKTAWTQGNHIPKKFIELAHWLGADFNMINLMRKEAKSFLNDNIIMEKPIITDFSEKPLPPNSFKIIDLINSNNVSNNLLNVIHYLNKRNLFLDDHDFYYSTENNYQHRLIIPFYHKNKIVGYTARNINNDNKPRYLSSQQNGYVFNIDKQSPSRKYSLLTEGPIDAIPLQTMATMGASINKNQLGIINSLNKPIIWIPDKDHTYLDTSKFAINNKWLVSLPNWDDDVKDINDSIIKYGRLTTLAMIMNNITNNYAKIITNSIWRKFK